MGQSTQAGGVFQENTVFLQFYFEMPSCQTDFINKKGVANGTYVLKK